jgi:hypothetical protein
MGINLSRHDRLNARGEDISYDTATGKAGADLFSEARRMSEPCCRLGAAI